MHAVILLRKDTKMLTNVNTIFSGKLSKCLLLYIIYVLLIYTVYLYLHKYTRNMQ